MKVIVRVIDRTWFIWHWFEPDWWRYLLADCRGWRNFWCRARGHRCGVVWYNPGATEPDMRCKNCGEYLE